MKLKTSELKQFKAKASSIPTNQTLPICSYLHFKPGNVTKNSLHSFIIMEIECDAEMLIDEKILMSYVGATNDEYIEVSHEGTQIILGSGKFKDYSPTDDVKNFPANDFPSGDWASITGIIPHIATCSALIMDEPQMPVQSHVFIGNGMVCGTDNIIAYIKPVEISNEIILSKFAAGLIGRLENAEFNETENYQFISTGITTYGFIKPLVKLANFKPFINDLDAMQTMLIEKSSIVQFNDHVISTAPMPNPTATMIMSLNNIRIEVTNAAYERTIQRDLECEGAMSDSFTFNTSAMNRLLKVVPEKTVSLTKFKNFLYITGKTGFISLIMQTHS